MSSTIKCTHCQFPMAVKDGKTSAIFCPSCGLFVDPFYSWKKTDIQSLTMSAQTSLWIPLVISASLKDAPVSSWVSPKHQVLDPDNKWGSSIHGYLAQRMCDADRGWILNKKIYTATLNDEADDLIAASVELVMGRDLKLLLDINDVKIGLAQAVDKYDGVIKRTEFLGKGAAAIHVFDPRNLTVKKNVVKPPVSPKKVVDDQAFMKSLKTAW